MANEWLACRRWPHLKGGESPEFIRTGTAHLIEGGSAFQRMDALAAQVAETSGDPGAARDTIVVCADPSAASRMRRKLESAAATGAGSIRVVTCRELACDILRQPQAAEAVGLTFTSGRTRILSAYETDFVMEDVKTLGTRPKRLRELLKFLYRGWTELSDEDPDWLFMAEEIETLEFLTEELCYLGAVMEPQISNLATKALRMDRDLLERSRIGRMFVLDYQNLSRASQLLCQLVADRCLVVAADGENCAEVHESYPYLKGVEDFLRLNPAASVAKLDGDAGDPARRSLAWPTPTDEIAGVADEIAASVEGGQNPSDIGVMTLHPWWARRMAHALEQRGVPVNAWYSPLRLRGDIRDLDRCLDLRVATLLRMLADPRDAAAWRSWFGFGDYLTRSNLFADMRKVRQVAAYPGDVRRDLEAFGFDLGCDLDPLMREASALRGPRLLGCLVETLAGSGAPVPHTLRPLLALGPDADAAQMVADLDRRQFFAGIPSREGVTVSSYEAMADLEFGHVYAVGFVNGLFPSASFFDLTKVSINKQEKMRAQDERTAHAMARLARESICVSRFERAEHEFAEKVGLRQARIFAADDSGTQLSEIEPSIYTDVLLGNA